MQRTRFTTISIFTILGVFVVLSLSIIRAGEEYAEAKRLAEAAKKDLHDFNNYDPTFGYFHGTRSNSKNTWKYFEEESKTRLDDWQRAAEAGIPEGQVLLGIYYLRSTRNFGASEPTREEGEKIVKASLELFHKAAEQDNADGQYWYGNWCHYVNDDKIKWYRKAAEQGHVRAQYELAQAFRDASYKNDAERREGWEESAKWYLKAAEQGHAESQWITGMNYRVATMNFPYDEEESAKWYRKAAEQGVSPAMSSLGICYLEGDGVPQDAKKAVEWFYKAVEIEQLGAEQGNSRAMHYLGECYLVGNGVDQNAEKAVEWFRKSTAQAHPFPGAWYKLGWCYATGTGVPQDKEEAMKWLREAEEKFPFRRKYSNETVALLKKLEAGVEINGKDDESPSSFWRWLFGETQGTGVRR